MAKGTMSVVSSDLAEDIFLTDETATDLGLESGATVEDALKKAKNDSVLTVSSFEVDEDGTLKIRNDLAGTDEAGDPTAYVTPEKLEERLKKLTYEDLGAAAEEHSHTAEDVGALSEDEKDNLLGEHNIDELASLLGLSRVITGTYTGNGNYGAEQKNYLTKGVAPWLVLVRCGGSFMLLMKGGSTILSWSTSVNEGKLQSHGEMELHSVGAEWYSDSAANQFNIYGYTYHYVMFY